MAELVYCETDDEHYPHTLTLKLSMDESHKYLSDYVAEIKLLVHDHTAGMFFGRIFWFTTRKDAMLVKLMWTPPEQR